MAPEIILALDGCEKNGWISGCGYSFAADIWSLGVMMYIMLVGRAPFESKEVKDTYKRIR
jgi:serine/threonine protein kinase